jgi:lysylphosphatidylglycerol synthetase-like protein (DUF2156 family)
MKVAELPPALSKGMRIRINLEGERAFNAYYDGVESPWLLYTREGKEMAAHLPHVECVMILPDFPSF